jgi:hypothetical protein
LTEIDLKTCAIYLSLLSSPITQKDEPAFLLFGLLVSLLMNRDYGPNSISIEEDEPPDETSKSVDVVD